MNLNIHFLVFHLIKTTLPSDIVRAKEIIFSRKNVMRHRLDVLGRIVCTLVQHETSRCHKQMKIIFHDNDRSKNAFILAMNLDKLSRPPEDEVDSIKIIRDQGHKNLSFFKEEDFFNQLLSFEKIFLLGEKGTLFNKSLLEFESDAAFILGSFADVPYKFIEKILGTLGDEVKVISLGKRSYLSSHVVTLIEYLTC